MSSLGALLGLGLALGIALVLSGLQLQGPVGTAAGPGTAAVTGGGTILGTAVVGPGSTVVELRRKLSLQLGLGGGAAVALFVLTRLPVAAAAAGAAGWFAPRMLGASRRERSTGTARIEAVATWTEMLRDGFDSGSFLESTIRSTETSAPAPIRVEVGRLCQRLRRARPGSTETALAAFAHEMADPTADMVVTALLMASRGSANNLAQLLSALATSARDEVSMRLRVETKRAEILMQRRLIIGVVVTFLAYLFILRRSYLHPFVSPTGQIVLGVVAAIFAVSLWLMDRLTRYEQLERTLRPEQ